ncbi:MAG: hypothetical protein GX372_01850 [Ignavibacteria bacterium]|jgi:hypothetical protein|nr:hypothetical protein [Ignavibacteria bacterium]
MKKNIFILLFILLFTSCELFVIKGKKIVIEEEKVEASRNSPLGTILLFISETQNDNILAATDLLAKPNNTLYSAEEKYEISSEVSRIKRYIGEADITDKSLSQTDDIYNIIIEFGYLRKVFFDVKKIDDRYYIINYGKKS